MKAQHQQTDGENGGAVKTSGGKAPLAEWLMAMLGVGLVVGVIGFLLYQGLGVKPGLPDIILEAGAPIETQDGYLVTVRVRNEGGETAADLTIEGTLEQDGETVETSQATLDYVPAYSTRQAGFFFAKDPRAFELVLRVGGYQAP